MNPLDDKELMNAASAACGDGGFFSTPDDSDGLWVLCVTPDHLRELARLVREHDAEAMAMRLIDHAVEKFWEAAPYKAVRFRDRDGDEGYYFSRD